MAACGVSPTAVRLYKVSGTPFAQTLRLSHLRYVVQEERGRETRSTFVLAAYRIADVRWTMFSFNFNPDFTMPCTLAPAGNANNDLYQYPNAIPCATVETLDVLTNDNNIIPSSLAITSATPGTVVSVTASSPYTLQWKSGCSGPTGWQGLAQVVYHVCSNAYSTTQVSATAYIVADTGPNSQSTITFIVPTWQPTTKAWSTWVTAGVFSLNPTSFTVVSPIPAGQGSATFDSTAQSVTFSPNDANAVATSMTVSICDSPPPISPAITPVCHQTVINWVPYYVHWINPSATALTVWDMYFGQVRHSNLLSRAEMTDND